MGSRRRSGNGATAGFQDPFHDWEISNPSLAHAGRLIHAGPHPKLVLMSVSVSPFFRALLRPQPAR